MPKFSLKSLSSEQKKIRKRLLELSHKAKFAHLGSCLSAIDIIDAVYTIKKPDEKFVLSNGHAGMALYVILEKHGFVKNLHTLKAFSVHPDRDTTKDIHVSTGSLGQGLPIALGMALADRKKNVYCMVSDGECEEGSIWEALKVGWQHNVTNLKIIVNANGWAAYDMLDLNYLKKRLKGFGYDVIPINGHNLKEIKSELKKKRTKPTIFFAYTHVEQFHFLKGLDAHYYVMKEEDYQHTLETLT